MNELAKRPDPNDLLLFARVAEAGSFSGAAGRLGLPKSTVSRRVAALEGVLGERLLQRTTRALHLTDFGAGVLEHARQIAEDVDAAAALSAHRQAEPSGRLRVSMPSDFANLVLADLLADFVARYPAIRLDLDLSSRRVDLVAENFDLALRMGDLPAEATLAARRLAVFSIGLYAAPAYLARRGTPSQPADLMQHEALALRGRDGDARPWRLARGEERWGGEPPARLLANEPQLLLRLARAGAGITAIEDHFALPEVESGVLRPVLADWRLPTVAAWAVFPSRRLMPAATRVLIDTLAAAFDEPRCQAVQAEVRRAKAGRSRA